MGGETLGQEYAALRWGIYPAAACWDKEPPMLAAYACDPSASRGRLCGEEESAFRSCFQRDRDRIIHSSAFRRLKHKTQVFVEHEGD